jgi:hypothetical protein
VIIGGGDNADEAMRFSLRSGKCRRCMALGRMATTAATWRIGYLVPGFIVGLDLKQELNTLGM